MKMAMGTMINETTNSISGDGEGDGDGNGDEKVSNFAFALSLDVGLLAGLATVVASGLVGFAGACGFGGDGDGVAASFFSVSFCTGFFGGDCFLFAGI